MKRTPDQAPVGVGPPYLPTPTLDLNELLLDHSAASFLFRVGGKLAIVDCAADPEDGCTVIVETHSGFLVEQYRRQVIFGVVTYLIQKAI